MNYSAKVIALLLGCFIFFGGAVAQDTQSYTIRASNELCEQEFAFTQKRHVIAKNALEQLLGVSLSDNQLPRIALCASGGGYRAMLATLGWLDGMYVQQRTTRSLTQYTKDMWSHIASTICSWFSCDTTVIETQTVFAPMPLSLLDGCMYCAALSGSTWAVTGWLQSRMPMTDYINHVVQQVSEPLLKNIKAAAIMQRLLEKESYGQSTSFIDIYGSVLAQKLLQGLGAADPDSLDLLSYKSVIDAAQMPLPICTSIIGEDVYPPAWVEYTPYEIGSTYLSSFIPTCAFGRKFYQGTTTDNAPCASLGYGMGVWGSAMAVSAQDVYSLLKDPAVQKVCVGAAKHMAKQMMNAMREHANTAKKVSLLQERLSPAQLYNWNYGVTDSKLADHQLLTLVDAGLDFNLPFPPLLRSQRAVDVIVVLDASAGELGGELRKAEKYARDNALPFPAIDYTIINQPCSVHASDQANVPVVIYMPLVQQADYCNDWDPMADPSTSTFNFHYTVEQAQKLIGATRFAMQQNMPMIAGAIKRKIGM